MDTDYAQQSFLSWMFSALGPMYTIVLPLSAVVCFILILILVWRGKTPMAAAALLLAVAAPALIGVFAYMQGTISSYYVIANAGGTPDPSKIAEAVSVSAVAPAVGMFLSIPGYLVALTGAFARSFASPAGIRKNAG